MNRLYPHNIEAEQSVLGSVLLESGLIYKVSDELSISDFYDKRHRIIFDSMCKLREEGKDIDYSTISAYIGSIAQLNEVGGVDYLAEISAATPSTANISTYIDIVRNFSIKRNLMETATKIVESGYDNDISAADYVDIAEDLIAEVGKRKKSQSLTGIEKVLEAVIKNAAFNARKDNAVVGLATGFTRLDEMTLGLGEEQLIILAARPAMGKSAFALNLAMNVARKNKEGKATVAIFSLEMSNEQLGMRMISSESNIEQVKIRSGNLTPDELRFLDASKETMSKFNIYFDDSAGISVNELRSKCRNLHKDHGLDFVVIDYLQLLSGDGRNGNRQEEVSKISRTLKHMARELKVPVLALSQLSREVEKREDKRPIMADLRESGSIEQDADIVMFIYREEYYASAANPSEKVGEAEIIIGKNRHGSTGSFDLLFDREYSKFKSKIVRNDIQGGGH